MWPEPAEADRWKKEGGRRHALAPKETPGAQEAGRGPSRQLALLTGWWASS